MHQQLTDLINRVRSNDTTLTSLNISFSSVIYESNKIRKKLIEALIMRNTLVYLDIRDFNWGRFTPKRLDEALFLNESLLFLDYFDRHFSQSRSTKWKEYIDRNHKIFEANLEKALKKEFDEIKNIKVFYSQLKCIMNHTPKTNYSYKKEDVKSAFEGVERYLQDNAMRVHGISKKSHLEAPKKNSEGKEVEGTQLPQDMWNEIFKYIKPDQVKSYEQLFGKNLRDFKEAFKGSQSSYKIVRFLVDIIRSITRVFKGPEEIPDKTKKSVDGLVKSAGRHDRKLELIEKFAIKIEPRNPELGGFIKEKVAEARKPSKETNAEKVIKASQTSGIGGRG